MKTERLGARAKTGALQERGSSTARGYGWKWQKSRLAFLAENPLCKDCEKANITTPATVVDHIIPHKADQNLFWDRANWQALCKTHHDIKTITEDGGLDSGAMTHPDWLPTPQCPVVLVTGPPGAGKTTYCKSLARISDEVIDLDECFTLVCGEHGHTADRKYLKQAIRLRNKMIAALKLKTMGTAYLIVSSPSQKECDWWAAKLNSEHVLIDPGIDVCRSRTSGRRLKAVSDWYLKAKKNDWAPPRGHPVVGDDGWPADKP